MILFIKNQYFLIYIIINPLTKKKIKKNNFKKTFLLIYSNLKNMFQEYANYKFATL